MLALGLAPLLAHAQDAELPSTWALRGRARMRFLGLSLYDIELWVEKAPNADAWFEHPLALVLTYARSFEGRAIAERSLQEMRRQGELDDATAQRWLRAMGEAFPDVAKGQRLCGRHDPRQGASFWFEGRPRPGLADPVFSRRFFGIWLAPQSSEPALRRQLLGLP